MGRFEDLFCLPLRGPSIQKPLRNGRERVLVVLRWAIRFEQRLWQAADRKRIEKHLDEEANLDYEDEDEGDDSDGDSTDDSDGEFDLDLDSESDFSESDSDPSVCQNAVVQ
ncbi:hypothetical protein F25303_10118 [Fusarium sp. NRRL 25303]|nr:hypothetical protein F25303_10118 [Fusarium sp. NRRL 25303]